MMTLHREIKSDSRLIYLICGADGDIIAEFASISDAAIVFRYLGGVRMSDSELTRAFRLLDSIDEMNGGLIDD